MTSSQIGSYSSVPRIGSRLADSMPVGSVSRALDPDSGYRPSPEDHGARPEVRDVPRCFPSNSY
jgi:hypothetical protein